MRNETGLIIAIKNQHEDIIRLLLSRNNTAYFLDELLSAADNGNISIMKMLLHKRYVFQRIL